MSPESWITNYFSRQVVPDNRFQSLPRTQNHNSQPPPKVPPRVALKPSREKVLRVKEEQRRQENSVYNVRNDPRRRSNPEIQYKQPQFSQGYTGGINDERGYDLQTMEVDLMRDSQGYGFSIRGGRELDLPIFVLRMAEGGAAQRDGRLRVSEIARAAFFKNHILVNFQSGSARDWKRHICCHTNCK